MTSAWLQNDYRVRPVPGVAHYGASRSSFGRVRNLAIWSVWYVTSTYRYANVEKTNFCWCNWNWGAFPGWCAPLFSSIILAVSRKTLMKNKLRSGGCFHCDLKWLGEILLEFINNLVLHCWAAAWCRGAGWRRWAGPPSDRLRHLIFVWKTSFK